MKNNLQIIKELESKLIKLILYTENKFGGFDFLNPFDFFNYKLNSNEEVIEFELSFQEIKTRNLKLIGELTSLQKLNLSFNKITTIQGLDNVTKLRVLNLYGNQITTTQGLEKLTNLQELNLGKNQITKIEGLEKLTDLKILDVSKNNISEKEIKEFRDKYPKIKVYA